MTLNYANLDIATATFDTWLVRTNNLLTALREKVVTTDSNTAIGNVAITGTMLANAINSNTALFSTVNTATAYVFGTTYSQNVSANSITSNTPIGVASGGTGANTALTARANLGVAIGTNVQAYDAGLQSISGLTTANNQMIYTTALDVYATTALTPFARTLLDDADATTARATLGAVIGTNVQAYDAGLQSISALTTAADKMIYTTASDTYATANLTSFARTLLDDANAATARATLGAVIGTDVQTQNPSLQSIADLVTAADKMIYTTAANTYATADLSVFARTLLDDTTAGAARSTLGVVIGTDVQAQDAGLQSIAGLTTAANKLIYTTAADTYATADLSAFGRTLVDDADAATARATLGLVIGTNVQAQDATLGALAGLTTAADRVPYFTGADTAAVAPLTAFGRSLIDDADAATARATLGVAIGSAVQAYDAGLQSIAGLTTAADKMIYTTAADTYATANLTSFARTVLASANAAVMRSTLNVIDGSSTVDIATPQTFTGLKSVTVSNSTTAQDYFEAKPSDYGPNKPAFYITKQSTANVWSIGTWDGASANATLNVTSTNFTWLGNKLATESFVNTGLSGKVGTTGNETIAGTKTFSGQTYVSGGLMLPSSGGSNYILVGNADNATYTQHNMILKGWWGMGMAAYNDVINGYYDFRVGKWDVKDGFYVDGVKLPTASSTTTFTNKTYNGGNITGEFGGVLATRLATANTAGWYSRHTPTDWGTGKPWVGFYKDSAAANWTIGLWDGVNNNGIINIASSGFTYNSDPIMTRAANETITGTKTFAATPILAANGVEGGEVWFKYGTDKGNLVATEAVLDVVGNWMRMYDRGGAYKGVQFDLWNGAIRTMDGSKVFLNTADAATVAGAMTFSASVTFNSTPTTTNLIITGTSPQIQFVDNDQATSGRNWWWHLNGDVMYLLRDGDNSGSWDGQHPLAINGAGQSATLFGALIATTTTSQTFTSKTYQAGYFTAGYREQSYTANVTGAYTIVAASGSMPILTLTGNTTYTFPTATAGAGFTLKQKQDATGGRTVVWPASVKWPGGTAPTITSTANKMDIFNFTADGTNWYGSVRGLNY